MTKQEATVIEMYTGVCMLAGDDRKYFYEYAEKLLGHPIMTHEYLEYAKRLKELSKPDFLKICESVKNDGWIPVEERLPEELTPVLVTAIQKVTKAGWDKGEEFFLVVDTDVYDPDVPSEWDYYKDKVLAWRPRPEPYRPVQTTTQRPEWQDRMLHTFLGGHHD